MVSATWDNAYTARSEVERSWTETYPQASLRCIEEAHLAKSAAIVDVGGGSSRLADELVNRVYEDVTVLDLSRVAVDEARARFVTNAAERIQPTWVVADILSWDPPRQYALWHDRAVFHFFITDADQRTYVEKVVAGTSRGSHLVIATFSPGGPEMCSGLPVAKWSKDGLAQRFAEHFSVVDALEQEHTTPSGATQPFTWLHMVRH